MSRFCSVCGEWFNPTKPYFHMCWPCWKESKEQATPAVIERLVPLLDSRTIRDAIALAHP